MSSPVHTKKSFSNETIHLDNNQFDHCEFDNCEIVYSGTGKFSLSNNSFNGCRWTFEGPAANAIEFMSAMYAMGGGAKDLIEKTFENIRRGAQTKPAAH